MITKIASSLFVWYVKLPTNWFNGLFGFGLIATSTRASSLSIYTFDVK